MISSKELRIDNLVTDEWNSTIIVVDSINENGINLDVKDDGNWPELAQHFIEPYYEFEKLYGIPITKEWLLKAGLLPDKQNLLFELPDNIKNKCKGDIGYKIVAYFFNKRLNRWMDCHTRVCVDFVHQLQNHVFVLTGEELRFE